MVGYGRLHLKWLGLVGWYLDVIGQYRAVKLGLAFAPYPYFEDIKIATHQKAMVCKRLEMPKHVVRSHVKSRCL